MMLWLLSLQKAGVFFFKMLCIFMSSKYGWCKICFVLLKFSCYFAQFSYRIEIHNLILGKQPLKYNCHLLEIQETYTAKIIGLTYPQLSLSSFCQRWVSRGLKVQ